MITEPSYQEIDQCHSSNEGQNLLYFYGLETDNLEPACYFIPRITFENVRYISGKIFFKLIYFLGMEWNGIQWGIGESRGISVFW